MSGSSAEGEQDGRAEVVAQFEAALRDRPDLDREEVEWLVEQFTQAVEDAPLEPVVVGLDRDSWRTTLDQLVQAGELQTEDRERLNRLFDDMMDPLGADEVKLALEFAQRIKVEGQEAALEWLAAKRSAEKSTREQKSDGRLEEPYVSKTATVKSRSRRLRGPPNAG